MIRAFVIFATVCCARRIATPPFEDGRIPNPRGSRIAGLLLAMNPGLRDSSLSRDAGKAASQFRYRSPRMRSMSTSTRFFFPRETSRMPRIKMQALADTLARRGYDVEEEVNNAYYSTAENTKTIEAYRKRVERINALEDDIEKLEDEELAAKTLEFRRRLSEGETEDDILEEAFAVVREAAWRTLELRHYDVQLIGGMGLHDGMIAQMGTGEGKTLVATGAMYLNALRGEGGNFLVTVNDYLARRDNEQMGQVYRFLGLSVGLIQQDMSLEQRKKAYACDVTYVTNSELGFDYLRDHCQTMQPQQIVLPAKLNFCIVDEGDAVLIDEARTPLIISGPKGAPSQRYLQAMKVANIMDKGTMYEVAEKDESVTFKEMGLDFLYKALNKEDLFDPADLWAPYIMNCIKAKEFKIRDKDYIVKDGKVEIVDIFSGRVLEGRRFGGGLHQAIEAKEGVELQNETEKVAQITYPALFRMFKKLSAMTGTALSETEELSSLYQLKVLDVPPALPKQRIDIPNGVYKTTEAKFNAAIEELVAMHETGRPVLLGTTNVRASEIYSERLDKLGIRHEVLNAKPDSIEREAEIVAQAGRKGSVTISTNMAGRGTDILLGGSPKFMATLRVRDALASAAGIAVPTVADTFFPCELSDETLQLLNDAVVEFVKEEKQDMKETNADRKLALDEMIAVASSNMEVYEGSATDLAREAYDAIKESYEEALESEEEEVALIGGLHVIGTNLHDSKRIDDQLKGRAGRQGDPGSTHFFLSLQDRIFKTFNGDQIAGVLDFLRVPDDTPLESDAVSKAIKDTQRKVESYFYSIRKESSDIDLVLNVQRQIWYDLRDQALKRDASQSLSWLRENVEEVAGSIVSRRTENSKSINENVAKNISDALHILMPSIDVSESTFTAKGEDEAIIVAKQAAIEALDSKVEYLNSMRGELAFQTIRYLALIQSDAMWKKHMETLELLKEGVTFVVYKNEKPLDVYREQADDLFQGMKLVWLKNVIYSLFQYDPAQKA